SYAAMVNLFALLFLMSVLAAALITNWTTRPLQLLRRGLERIGLGTRNEPIPYRGNDELGQLVEVYNRKVEELRISAEKLARSERESAWREMARQVAHEIKNPLTPMKLNIQHFQRTWTPDEPDAKERLDRLSAGLVDQIDALSHIADEFTHFAQMPPARPVDLDLGEVARSSVALYAQQPGTTVELEGDEEFNVHIDPDHLLRILNNLIKNAQQAIPPEREGHVRVMLKRAGDEVIMEVRDNGEGISEEWRERIFTPNFTTKSSGMGLGLSMVQRMVEHAGGRVWFETTTGVGTSFFVALPSKQSPDTFAATERPAP
ncbi:MAG: ATP-binding protein, partial [Flavobacteriales bacterium]